MKVRYSTVIAPLYFLRLSSISSLIL